jgi:anaerobic dimethyl sulfoxide reductase subunit B (iron-sulfur subunit)
MTSALQATPTTTAKVTQYGFFFDQGRCIGCQDCMLACMSWNSLPVGAAGRWIRNIVWEEGSLQNIRWYGVSVPCYHCENPPCIPAAKGALYKESKYGAVLLDPAKAKTQALDLRAANEACPYGAIVFDSDDATSGIASKCTMCIDRLEQGLLPVCVLACDTRAWDFGPMDKMVSQYGNSRALPGFPDPAIAQPACVFKAQIPRKNIVGYDWNKALDLWQTRGPYAGPDEPKTFQNKGDVMDPQKALVQKNKVQLKYKSNEEMIYYTMSEE